MFCHLASTHARRNLPPVLSRDLIRAEWVAPSIDWSKAGKERDDVSVFEVGEVLPSPNAVVSVSEMREVRVKVSGFARECCR